MCPCINGLEWGTSNFAEEATRQKITFAGESACMICCETVVFDVLQDLFAHVVGSWRARR